MSISTWTWCYGEIMPLLGPVIKINGHGGTITNSSSDSVSVTIKLVAGKYSGIPADHWVIVCAGETWYYLNDSLQWIEFDGNLSNCHPAYQGSLINLPMREVLHSSLPAGLYTFWFAVDFTMDGVLDIGLGKSLYSSVELVVE